MNEINTTTLLNQLSLMSAEAAGSSVELAGKSTPFAGVFKKALTDVNELHQKADELKTQYEMGNKQVSISEVMVAAQKASISFEATLRVRNKLVDAYQELMNMPV